MCKILVYHIFFIIPHILDKKIKATTCIESETKTKIENPGANQLYASFPVHQGKLQPLCAAFCQIYLL